MRSLILVSTSIPHLKKIVLAVSVLLVALTGPMRASTPPHVGETAPTFTLRTLDEKPIELAALLKERPVLLVVLRGWPGYQCPICTKQVHEFITRASDFTAQGAQVLMIYPGPAENLQAHAKEFLQDKQWPAEFLFVIDPDYAFTNLYGLRWNAKNETAYPSMFVVDQTSKVRFAHISHTHGDRVSAPDALNALRETK